MKVAVVSSNWMIVTMACCSLLPDLAVAQSIALDGDTLSALLRYFMPLILAMLSTPESTSEEIAFPDIRFTVYSELDAAARTASAGLGYDQFSWDNVGTRTIEAYSWFTNDLVNPDFAPLATTLELDEDAWDCYLNHYGDYDWDELELYDIAIFYEALGWSQSAWDSGSPDLYPDTEEKFWAELSAPEQAAAEEICFLASIWDGVPLPIV